MTLCPPVCLSVTIRCSIETFNGSTWLFAQRLPRLILPCYKEIQVSPEIRLHSSAVLNSGRTVCHRRKYCQLVLDRRPFVALSVVFHILAF